MEEEIRYSNCILMITMIILGRSIRLGRRRTRKHCKLVIEFIAACFDKSNQAVLDDVKEEYSKRSNESPDFLHYSGHGWE